MPNLNNGALAPTLPACPEKRKAAPPQSSLKKNSENFSRARRNLTARQRKALQELLSAPGKVTVKRLVAVTDANNVPELIASLRKRGLEIPCEMVPFVTVDGVHSRYGCYALTDLDKARVKHMLGGS